MVFQNCSDATTGPHCEFCAEGHYKDSSGKCRPCLCPSENQNFAKNCTFDGRNNFLCICKRGYSGRRCDKCEETYWGNPQTGGNCQPCNCNPYGSENLNCDKATGECKCKPGFTGERCSKCSSARNVIQDGVCMRKFFVLLEFSVSKKFSACDECTQILFGTIDELSNSLNDTLDSLKDGVGPPWIRLKEVLNRKNNYSYQFDNLEKTKKLIDNANIPELEKRVQKIKQNLPKRNELLSEQTKIINNLSDESRRLSKSVQKLDDRIDDLIKSINGFGKSHIDLNEALSEAKKILDEIVGIVKEAPNFDYDQILKSCQKLYDQVNQIYGNDLNTTEVEKKLNDLKDRLSKFKKLLEHSDRITRKAEKKNEKNLKRIRVLKDTIGRINDHNEITTENIKAILEKINATNDILREISAISEFLETQNLENATSNLEDDDVENLYEILTSVREHVKKLQNKVKFYKDVLNFSPEEWTKINASASYENIIKGIEEARIEAKKARDTTLEALKKLYPSNDDSLPDKTNLAVAFSDRIQKRVQNLKNLTEDFSKTSDELEDLKQDILFNGKSNNELNSFLRDIQKDIRNQSDIILKLKSVKNEARNVSTLIASIDQRVKDTNISLQYELTKSYYNYLNLTSAEGNCHLRN